MIRINFISQICLCYYIPFYGVTLLHSMLATSKLRALDGSKAVQLTIRNFRQDTPWTYPFTELNSTTNDSLYDTRIDMEKSPYANDANDYILWFDTLFEIQFSLYIRSMFYSVLDKHCNVNVCIIKLVIVVIIIIECGCIYLFIIRRMCWQNVTGLHTSLPSSSSAKIMFPVNQKELLRLTATRRATKRNNLKMQHRAAEGCQWVSQSVIQLATNPGIERTAVG